MRRASGPSSILRPAVRRQPAGNVWAHRGDLVPVRRGDHLEGGVGDLGGRATVSLYLALRLCHLR